MTLPATDPVKLEVTLKYATISEFDARFAANVGSTTLFLKTPKPKPVGCVVALELHLAGGDVVLAGQGPVLCAFEGASVPVGRQAGMIIGLHPADDNSAKRIRAIVVKYGQGKNSVLPAGVVAPSPPAAPVPTPATATPANGDSLDDLGSDLDAAIAGLGSSDPAPAAPPMASSPRVQITTATSPSPSLFDPGPGLVMVQPQARVPDPLPPQPAPPATVPAPPAPAPTVKPPPASSASSVDVLSGSSWTDELEAALGTAFDVEPGLPTPPAAARPVAPIQPPAAAASTPRSLDGMFGPPEMISTEPVGMPMLKAEQAFSMPPPTPALTPTGGVLRVEPAAEAAPTPDTAASLPPAVATTPAVETSAETASPVALAASMDAEHDDDMLAPLPAGDAAESAGQASDNLPVSEPPASAPSEDPAASSGLPSNITEDSLQAIAAGLPPPEYRPAFKPEVPLPPPVVVTTRRRETTVRPPEAAPSSGDHADLGSPDSSALIGTAPVDSDRAPVDAVAMPPSTPAVDAGEPTGLAIPQDAAGGDPLLQGGQTAADAMDAAEPDLACPPLATTEASALESDSATPDAAPATEEPGTVESLDEELSRDLPPLPNPTDEIEETMPVRARRSGVAPSGKMLGIAGAAGALLGVLLFVVFRLLFAEPDHITQFREANALVRTGKSAEAIAVYEKILAAHPEFTLAKRHLAVALALQGDWARSEQVLRNYMGTSEDIADIETVKKYLGEAEAVRVE
ncbi:MAG: tetratricopeptide repeat protein [Pseudomonadota bacterium]